MPLRSKNSRLRPRAALTLGVAATLLAVAPSTSQAGVLTTLLGNTGKAVSATTTTVTKTVNGVTTTATGVVSTVLGVTTSTTACAVQPTTKAFAKVGDASDYSLAPGGNFESGGAAWNLTGGAKIVSGNESLGITGGSRSLQLPAGATASSPVFCVDQTNPHFRFTTRANGLMTGYLAVVLYRDAAGKLTQAQFTGSADSSLLSSSWSASALSPLATNIPLTLAGKIASVQLMFVAIRTGMLGILGLTGTVGIDSVMVDPYRRG